MNDQDPQSDVSALADELIAIRCQLGERAAFDQLVRRWHEPLCRYVRGVVPDEDAAAEVVQEIWLRILRGIPGLRDPSRLRAWVFGIARRTLMDRLRARYREPEPLSLEDVDPPAAAEAVNIADDLQLLQEEIARLPLVEREVIVLFHLDELTLAEISDLISIPIGTVKSRLFRARRLLREQLIDRRVNE